MATRFLRPARHDKGYVLVWVIFYLMLLSLIVVPFANTSFLEGLMSVNHRQAAQAYEMADGGVLAGTKEIYDILNSDYSNSQDIPAELVLSQREWILNESGREMGFYLENPKRSGVDGDKCRFQLVSKGVSPPAQRTLTVEVQVEFRDIYVDIGGETDPIFHHREFIYPAKVISMQYKI